MNKIETSVGEEGLSSEHQEILDDPGKVKKTWLYFDLTLSLIV